MQYNTESHPLLPDINTLDSKQPHRVEYYVELDIIPDIKRSGERDAARNQVNAVASNVTNILSRGVQDRSQPIVSKASHKLTSGLFLNPSAVFQTTDLIQVNALPEVKSIKPLSVKQIILDVSVPQINAPLAWQTNSPAGQSITGQGIKVAVIDSGVDYTHADLGQSSEFGQYNDVVVDGYDFANGNADGMDHHYHGTHVASTVVGVAPDAQIYAYAVCDEEGNCYNEPILSALEAAVENNIDVVNMSLGGAGYPFDDPVVDAVNTITEQTNTVIVISAGNSGPGSNNHPCRSNLDPTGASYSICSPACAENSIAVAASTDEGEIAGFSSRGPTWPFPDGTTFEKPDVAAPGAGICAAISYLVDMNDYPESQCFGDLYHAPLSGTSMAAPHVAGAAALIKQVYPDANTADVKYFLKFSAEPLNCVDCTPNAQGAGRIDLTMLTQYESINQAGCIDSEACNYNPFAISGDDSCEYAQPYRSCTGMCYNDLDNDDVCDEEDNFISILGCTDPTALNYNSKASTLEPDSCFYYEDLPFPSELENIDYYTNHDLQTHGYLPGNPFRNVSTYSQSPAFYGIDQVTIHGQTYGGIPHSGHPIGDQDIEVPGPFGSVLHTHYNIMEGNRFYLGIFCGTPHDVFAWPEEDHYPADGCHDIITQCVPNPEHGYYDELALFTGPYHGGDGFEHAVTVSEGCDQYTEDGYHWPLEDCTDKAFVVLEVDETGAPMLMGEHEWVGGGEDGVFGGGCIRQYVGDMETCRPGTSYLNARPTLQYPWGTNAGMSALVGESGPHEYNINLIGNDVTTGALYFAAVWGHDFSTNSYPDIHLCDVDVEATVETGMFQYEIPTFIIYDSLTQSYHRMACSGTIDDGKCRWPGVFNFDASVSLTEMQMQQTTGVEYDLDDGNNLISFPFQMDNSDVSDFMYEYNITSIIGAGAIAQIDDDENISGNLSTFNPNHGYWVNSPNTQTVNVSGTGLSQINYAGEWSGDCGNALISYDGIQSMDTIEALPNSNCVNFILGQSIGLFNYEGEWSGNLTTVQPKKGYWVNLKCSAECKATATDLWMWNHSSQQTLMQTTAVSIDPIHEGLYQQTYDEHKPIQPGERVKDINPG